MKLKGELIPIIPPFGEISHINMISLIGLKDQKEALLQTNLPRLTFQMLRIYYGQIAEESGKPGSNNKGSIHDIPYFYQDTINREKMLSDLIIYEIQRLENGGDTTQSIIGYQGMHIFGAAQRPNRSLVTFIYLQNIPVTNIYLRVPGRANENIRFKPSGFKRMNPKRYLEYLENNKIRKEYSVTA